MAHRLFLAIPLAPAIVSAITKFQANQDIPDVRWTRKENVHITVHFFGAVEDEHIGELVECIEDAVRHIAPFELEVSGLEFGPPGRPARMVWLLFQPSSEFRALVEAIRQSIRERLGMRSEAHGPTTHVTVARFNDPRAVDDIALPSMGKVSPFVSVENLILYESDLKRAGPEYTVMQTFGLGGGDFDETAKLRHDT